MKVVDQPEGVPHFPSYDDWDSRVDITEPRFIFVNLSSTLTTAQAVAVVLGIAAALALAAGLLVFAVYYLGNTYGGGGYDGQDIMPRDLSNALSTNAFLSRS